MAGYLGHKPKLGKYAVDEFTTSAAQASSGDFVLSQTVTDERSLEVSVGGVDQPTTAYSVSGTTLAFGANIVAENDIVIVRHAGESILYPTLEANVVTTAKINANAVDGTKIADNAINSEHYTDASIDEAHIAADAVNFVTHLKTGTDGELITWDASGNPAAVPVGTATHVLTSGGTGVAPTFQAAGGGGGITHASEWRLTANLTFVTGSGTTISANLEEVDSTGVGILGSSMTQSSGIFTFPSTGIWAVTVQALCLFSAGVVYSGVDLDITLNNGGAWDGGFAPAFNSGIAGYYNASSHTSIVDVTNTSNVKVRFLQYAASVNGNWSGDTNNSYTSFVFVRLGDT